MSGIRLFILLSSVSKVSRGILEPGITEDIFPPMALPVSKSVVECPARVRCQAAEIPPGPAPMTAILFLLALAGFGGFISLPALPRSLTSMGLMVERLRVQDAMQGLGQRYPHTVAGKGVYSRPMLMASSMLSALTIAHRSWMGIPVGQAAWQGDIYFPCSQTGT